MGSRILVRSLSDISLRRNFYSSAYKTAESDVKYCSDLIAYLNEKPKDDVSQGSRIFPCIYRVPKGMHKVEPEAFAPKIISVGPYHYNAEHLRAMEKLKLQFCRRLCDPTRVNGVRVENIIDTIENVEQDARICYKDCVNLSKEEFVRIMVVDCCFIIEFLKEFHLDEIKLRSKHLSNWMVSHIRRDLIMLENQLPFFVLDNVFKLASGNAIPSGISLQDLALKFLNPLVHRDSETLNQIISEMTEYEARHFLDLFRSSILPKTMIRSKEEGMIATVTGLSEAGIMIEKPRTTCRPLDIRSEGRVLKVPPIYIDDYKGTVFRNMMAFEQCHGDCMPDVTSYLFFLDGLINSREDVNVLQYEGILNHSLGSNKELAKLVNNLCKEIPRDPDQSYLFKVVDDTNFYCNSLYAKIRAAFVHHYFQNWIVGVSTLAAVFALYLALVQTGSGVASVVKDLRNNEQHFFGFIKESILLPFYGKPRVHQNPTDPEEGS